MTQYLIKEAAELALELHEAALTQQAEEQAENERRIADAQAQVQREVEAAAR